VLGTSKPRPMCRAVSPMSPAISTNIRAKEPPLNNTSHTQPSTQRDAPIGQFNYPDPEADGPGTFPLNVAQGETIHPMTRHEVSTRAWKPPPRALQCRESIPGCAIVRVSTELRMVLYISQTAFALPMVDSRNFQIRRRGFNAAYRSRW
jgi:hypothetical protein